MWPVAFDRFEVVVHRASELGLPSGGWVEAGLHERQLHTENPVIIACAHAVSFEARFDGNVVNASLSCCLGYSAIELLVCVAQEALFAF